MSTHAAPGGSPGEFAVVLEEDRDRGHDVDPERSDFADGASQVVVDSPVGLPADEVIDLRSSDSSAQDQTHRDDGEGVSTRTDEAESESDHVSRPVASDFVVDEASVDWLRRVGAPQWMIERAQAELTEAGSPG